MKDALIVGAAVIVLFILIKALYDMREKARRK
jgi:hypothetical protein